MVHLHCQLDWTENNLEDSSLLGHFYTGLTEEGEGGGGGAILKVDITNAQAGIYCRLKERGTVT